MTLYNQFRSLNIDLSPLGFTLDETRGGYFCTPLGAKIFGWAGVDGIHFCFIQGRGEMVFSVNPSNLPEDCVHPLSRSFADFLRLLLACGLDAAEQAWMWNRGEFDAFTETYPPTPEQQSVLAKLQNALHLTPMPDPYGYIKEVQSAFDSTQIPYSKEYNTLVSERAETQNPPQRPEWKVYFENGFSSRHRGHDKPGQKIPLGKTFLWGGNTWHIPALYTCGKGLVMDLCMEIDPADLQKFLQKWWPHGEESARPRTPEEQEQLDAENPMTRQITPVLTINGKELHCRSGNGMGWAPDACRPESERGRSRTDWDAVWFMEHYGLDAARGWMFWRDAFPWATKTRPVIKNASLFLKQGPVPFSGPRFEVSSAGGSIPFTHPVTGEACVLHITEYEAQEIDTDDFQKEKQWIYPTHYVAMSYRTEPELPDGLMTVRDCAQGDSPRMRPQKELEALAAIGGADGLAACSIGIIGGADGPTAIFLGGKSGRSRTAVSSLYFALPEEIEWRIVFRQKTVEDIELALPLPENGQ